MSTAKLPPIGKRRIAVLAEGKLNVWDAKTAVSVVRWCPDEIACVIDSQNAGGDLQKLVATGAGVPIVKDFAAALPYKPNCLLIGVANMGGFLPPAFRPIILKALDNKMHILSGLHEFLADDPQFAKKAKQKGVVILDARRLPDEPHCNENRTPFLVKNRRVLTVGTDCNLGKMTVSLVCNAAALKRGWKSRFVATGQTGIFISGHGLPIDRTISDFTSGAMEQLMLESKNMDWVWVEGQGGIAHPAFSTVTLGLLHGTAPTDLILVTLPSRKTSRHMKYGNKLPSLPTFIRIYEDLAALVLKAKVRAIGVNGVGLTDKQLADTIKKIEDETGLPAADPIRMGADVFLNALSKKR
ncbi:MAG TPA: DUF1611 domain-containing protein [Planctomycetota bacterium]|nr:DUF1611 domain-containing protein [Planctomycetota bacterium]